MKTRFTSLPLRGQAYLSSVIVAGLLVIVRSSYELYTTPLPQQWFLLAALTLLSGSVTVKLPSIPATISVSETFVFTSVLLFGTAAGTITVTLDGLIISLWLQRKRLETYKLLFNTTAPALSIWLAAKLFFALTGKLPLTMQPSSTIVLLPGLLVFAAAYFLLNSWLMAIAVSFQEPLTPLQVWRQNFLWLSLSFFSGASVAILLVSLNREVNLSALAVIVPILIISYLTYHTSMARVADANRHVEKLNQLYLSTIETLALAIDAKDQITHGHIRRVQTYSVSLAKQLGVHDQNVIQAIEAASLLHDMGKLAIPEHILNKPGKLDSSEFEIMKVHSTVGADILASVEFPYPVVPIVRHHHENWDGTGYPDGLSGTEIPIGARILAVVDCFDALTSDRPYRAKLGDSEALAILERRRGVMYDPLVVDTFKSLYGQIVIPTTLSRNDTVVLTARMQLREAIASAAGLIRSNVATESSESLDLPYSIEVIASYFSKVLPGSLLVLYELDRPASLLRVTGSWGVDPPAVKGLTIPLGKGVSGWAAAYGRSIHGANASKDFACSKQPTLSKFQRCSSTPIISRGYVSGVLTIYLPDSPSTQLEGSLQYAGAHLSSYLPLLGLSS